MTAARTLRAGLVVAMGLLTAALTLVGAPRAEALDGDDFTAGMIITDSLFFDGTSLNAGAIDEFIAKKNPGCAVGRTCIENYVEDITSRAADSRCKAIAAKKNQTAGEIIATVGAACGISPKAILVILQKEQSLITSTSPSSHAFAYAMGAGCPDTPQGCDTPYQGLFAQVYYGSWLLKGYTLPTSSHYNRYGAGRTSAIAYDVESYNSPPTCDFVDVYVENQATHALYVYTPYTPNQAALDNLYGSGDRCSAYGNRNFWRMYNDWFGSTRAGQSLVRAAGSSNVYLLTPEGRWAFDGDVPVSEYSDLGKVGVVSSGYVKSFPLRGTVSHYIYDTGVDEVWAVYGGERHRIGGCASDLVTALGVDCDAIPRMDRAEALRIDRGDRIRPLVVTETGDMYYLERAGRHAVSGPEAPADSGAGYTGDVTTVPAALLTDVARLEVMVADGEAVTNGSHVLYRGGDAIGRVGKRLWDQAHLDRYIAEPVGIAGGDWIVPEDYQQLSGFIRAADAGTTYMFRLWGLTEVGDAAPEDHVAVISDSLVPDAPVNVGMPLFVAAVGDDDTYMVDSYGARLIPPHAKRYEVANALGVGVTAATVPTTVFQSIGRGPDMLDFGAVVAVDGTSEKWFIDGGATRWRVYSRQAAELSGGVITTVDASAVEPYATGDGYGTLGMRCLRSVWMVVGGERYELTEEEAAHLEAAFPFRTVQWATCRALPEADQEGGRVLEKPAGAQFLVTDGVASRVTRGEDVSAYGEPVRVLRSTVALFGG
ncbi:hypothetical protein [Demequina rhizosphaerae]|uniref:hypothetical protein n=1 Tax=Demequina rhizosphaerae TaxID=1638985 RepID=UPI0007856BA8|nr:hypothetical protein [Demequina rhizosphaerae]